MVGSVAGLRVLGSRFLGLGCQGLVSQSPRSRVSWSQGPGSQGPGSRVSGRDFRLRQEQVVIFASVIILSEKKKHWVELYLKLFQHFSFHNPFDLVHSEARLGKHSYFVTSQGAQNYEALDVLLNLLWGARTFVHHLSSPEFKFKNCPYPI